MIKFEKTIVPQIKHYREKLGMSVTEFADRVGVSRQYIYNLEKGESIPTLTVSFKIAEILGTSLESIFSRKPLLKEIVKNKTLDEIHNLATLSEISKTKIIQIPELKEEEIDSQYSKEELRKLARVLGMKFEELFLEE